MVQAPWRGARDRDQRTAVAWANSVAVAVATKARPATMGRSSVRRRAFVPHFEKAVTRSVPCKRPGSWTMRRAADMDGDGGRHWTTPDPRSDGRPAARLLPGPARVGGARRRHDLLGAARPTRPGGLRPRGP